jgi:hypothetical protein
MNPETHDEGEITLPRYRSKKIKYLRPLLRKHLPVCWGQNISRGWGVIRVAKRLPFA